MRIDSIGSPSRSPTRSFGSRLRLGVLVSALAVGCSGSGPTGGGSFTLVLSPATLTITQGGSGSITVTITRTGEFTGGVTITVEGLPAGVSAQGLTIGAGSTSGQLFLAGTVAASLGSVTLTVRGSGSGVSDRTSSVQLTVVEGNGGGGNTSVLFCQANGIPRWVAYKDGAGPWAQAIGGPNMYSFQVDSEIAGVAWVTGDAATGFSLVVNFGSRAEVDTLGDTQCGGIVGGGKTVTGMVQGIPANAFATTLTLGGRSPVEPPALATPTVVFNEVRDGDLDLVGGISVFAGGLAIVPSRMFVRRNLGPGNGGAINDIDMGGPDSFPPLVSNLAVNNVGVGEQVLQTTQLNTANGSSRVAQVLGPTATTNWYGAPPARLEAGDLQLLTVLATGPPPLPPSRQVVQWIGVPANLVVNIGPYLTQPNVVAFPGTGHTRARAEYQIQADYDRFWVAAFQQPQALRQVQIQMTQGFRIGGGGTVTLEIPDFVNVGGWLPTWGLRTVGQVTWTVTASGWTSPGGVIQPAPADGNVGLTATRQGQFIP